MAAVSARRLRAWHRAGQLDAEALRRVVREALEEPGGDGLVAQRALHEAIFADPVASKYPPPRAPRQRLLKAILAELESGALCEVDDELYSACVEGLAEAEAARGGFDGYRVLEAAGSGGVALRVTSHMGGDVETGCLVWSAGCALFGLLLAGHLDAHVRGHILELGAGTGLAGLAAARRGGGVASVTLTDGQPAVVTNLRHNLEATAEIAPLAAPAFVQLLDWGSLDGASELPHPPDVVIGSDLSYEPAAIPLLTSLLGRLLRPRGSASHAVLVLTRRSEETRALFRESVAHQALRCEDLCFPEAVAQSALECCSVANDFRALGGEDGPPRLLRTEGGTGAVDVLCIAPLVAA